MGGYYETETYLQTYTRNLVLLESIIFDDVRQCASLHVLHDNPKFIALHEIRFQEVDNVGMLGFFHNEDFVDDEFLPRLVRQIHLLNSNLLACCESFGNIDMSRCTDRYIRI